MRWSPSGPVGPGQLTYASRSSHAARSLHPAQAAAFRVRDPRSGRRTCKGWPKPAAGAKISRSSHESPEKGYAGQRLSSPSCTCSLITVPVVCSQAATMMARSCSRAAHYALRAAASPHSTRCTPARTAHARAAAGAAPDAALCSHLACSLDAVGPHDALRACCSAPACPACELIEQAHQPHCWGGPGPNFGGKQCL